MTLPRSRPRVGVTLVELVCVTAIIVILVALMLGPIVKAFAHAKTVIGH